jgi:hypothetical protein
MTTTTTRTISEIAIEIKQDWKNPNYGAVPYLDAMLSINNINDDYFQDSASSVVIYFLSNARTWKGETAKRIKAELNKMLK